jgi:PQQ-dependent dehydrogenase (s-GDH family)
MTLAKAALAAAIAIPLAVGTAGAAARDSDAPASPDDFSSRVLTTELSNPFEVVYAADGKLWVTERSAGRVTRVDPASGEKSTALTIPDVVATPGAQDGLLGMALQPGFLQAKHHNHVYLSYTYDLDARPTVLERRQKIVRYSYSRRSKTLGRPRALLTGLPASNDHNSGRLIFAPDGTLVYTLGDQGHNQFANACLPDLAQVLPTAEQVARSDWTAYQGKILRLEPDGSIPADNPTIHGVRSHVYSYGHRNAQGIVFAPDGKLYSSEQGPKSDDELNLILAGRNYGWPNVAGYKDDSAYVYGNWSAWPGCTPDAYSDFVIPPEVPVQAESSFNDRAFVPPLRTFYTVPPSFDFQDPRCAPSGLFFICWPTVAPSGLDVYTSSAIPGWADSLLMPTLKTGAVMRLPLSGPGTVVDGPLPLWNSVNRFRDTAIAPDGTTIYVATDSDGLARGADGLPTTTLQNPGSILEFRYRGAPARR